MGFKKNKLTVPEINTFDSILITPPTERWILWLTAKDPSLFNIKHLLDIASRPDIMKPNPESNNAKAMTIYMGLVKKGYIKKIDGFKSKVTWRGQFYRLFTHFALMPILAIFGIGVALFVWWYPKTPTYTAPQQQKQIPQSSITPAKDTASKKAVAASRSYDTVALKIIHTPGGK